MITLKQAKTILKSRENELAGVKKRVKELVEAKEAEVLAIKRIVIKLCPHDNIREEDASDYHNNCPWTAKYCKDCGAYLGKY